MYRALILSAAVAALAAPAAAAVVTPVSVTASDTWFSYNANNLINGSGLSNGLHDTSYTNMWQSDWNDDTHWLVFDLGAEVRLASTSIWQYAANFGPLFYETNRGVKDLSVSISKDGVTYTTVADVEMTRQILTADTQNTPFAAQVFELNGVAQYVRFDISSNHGFPPYNETPWTGLSEVRFNSAVPEAATWAMLIMGFGLVGSAMRRRRAIVA